MFGREQRDTMRFAHSAPPRSTLAPSPSVRKTAVNSEETHRKSGHESLSQSPPPRSTLAPSPTVRKAAVNSHEAHRKSGRESLASSIALLSRSTVSKQSSTKTRTREHFSDSGSSAEDSETQIQGAADKVKSNNDIKEQERKRGRTGISHMHVLTQTALQRAVVGSLLKAPVSENEKGNEKQEISNSDVESISAREKEKAKTRKKRESQELKDAADAMLMSSIQRLLQKSNPIQENDKQKKEENKIECEKGNTGATSRIELELLRTKIQNMELQHMVEMHEAHKIVLLAATQTAHQAAKEEAAHVKSPFAAVPQQLQQQNVAVSFAAQSRTPSLGVMIPRGSGRVERASAAGTPPPPLPL